MTETNWFSDDAATFGDRLAGAREAAGLKQSELAAQLGVKVETLIAWEHDLKEPRANRLQMLSGMLGVSLSWLLTGEGDGPSEPGDVDAIPEDISTLLGEIRAVRTQIMQRTERLGQLEKRLRAALKDA